MKKEHLDLLTDLYRRKGMGEKQHCEMSMMVKDVDSVQGIITGYASAFGIVDSDNDIVEPGAFKRTIQQRGPNGSKRIAFLRQHRVELLLGRPSVLKEDKTGLYFESKISDTSYGKDALILYQDGVINEHSIGFDTVKQERTTDKPTRLLELRLWDVSAVTWGANDQTPFLGMKSVQDFKKAFDQIDSVNRALAHGITDDTAFTLELWIRQFQQSLIDFTKCLNEDDSRKAALANAAEASHQEIAQILRRQTTEMDSYTKRQR